MPPVIALPPRRLWTPPRPAPVPTEDDVKRYKRLRAAGKRLKTDLTATVPKRAMDDIGKALGIIHGSTFIFDSEEVSDVFTDCCLLNWVEDGKNLVQKLAEESPPPEGTDEREILDATLRARYSIFKVEECIPGAGARGVDLFRDEEFFVIDMGMGSSSVIEGAGFASYIIPIGEFWMTGGASLPIDGRTLAAARRNVSRMVLPAATRRGDLFDSPHVILTVIRSCLEAGMADHMRHQDIEEEESPGGEVAPRAFRRRPSRNAPCPCGSDRRYKRCCGRGKRARAS